jgi:hypothetical protein
MDAESSNLAVTVALSVLTMAGWVWLAVIKWQEKRTWHTWGCLIYGVSYLMLVLINTMSFKLQTPLPVRMATTIYAVTIIQLGAVISFIFNSYMRDHPAQ